MPALDGLEVVDFTRGLPGAVATLFLADNGAEVLRIEPPAGDELARGAGFATWHRGKRKVLLDLKDPAGRSKAQLLASRADVVVESFRPGVVERLGLGYAEIRKRNAAAIYVSISGYGPRGPFSGRPGYDGLVMAAAGLQGEQPAYRPGPCCFRLPLAALGAGLLALQGILAALHVRDGTGHGQHVATSLYQGAIAYRSGALAIDDRSLRFPARVVDPQGAKPAYRIYRCADGKYLQLGCQSPDFWAKLAIALDCLELVTDPRFAHGPQHFPTDEDRLAAIAVIGKRLSEFTRDEWVRRLEAGDVPCAPVQAPEALRDNPQVLANGMQLEVEAPDRGRTLQIGLPVRFSRTPGRVRDASSASAPDAVLRAFRERSTGEADGHPRPAPPRSPLEDLRVLDFSSYVAGPLCSTILGDLGADVIKIESLAGDNFRSIPSHFAAVNRGKRGIAVDLKHAQGRRIVDRLIGGCSVVVHNMRASAAARLGLDYERLKTIKPALVYLHIAAYGSTGPESQKPGYDAVFQSLTGVTASQGGCDQPPIFLQPAVCDTTTPMVGAAAVLMALHVRNASGEGQKIETSLLNNGLLLSAEAFLDYAGKPDLPRLDRDHLGFSALYRLYATGEGWIFLACVREREWQRLLLALGSEGLDLGADPRFATATERARHDAELAKRLTHVFSSRSALAWAEVAHKQDVPLERVASDYAEGWVNNPQAQALGMVVRHRHPEFPGLTQIGTLVDLSLTPQRFRGGPPVLGEHTDEVLREAGFSAAEIGAFRESRIVA